MRDRLRQTYHSILKDYLAGGGEAAVLRAYDFARECLRGGLAPDDVVEFHIDLVDSLTGAEVDTARARAQQLLLEVIMAFSLGYRQTLEELERSNQELERVSRFKSRMLSMVAHDLTNHITAIKIYAGSITKLEDTTKSGEYARHILDVIKDQELLIKNLLDISSIETGRLQVTIAPQPIMEIVERTVSRISKLTNVHKFSTVGPRVNVLADRAKLQQIVDNLIGNAVKYSPQGGRVDVTVSEEHQQAVVSVQDQGMGIAPEDLPNLFEPFFRGAVASRSSIPGTGLGLSIVRSLLLLQGGDIRVESGVGEGTRMSFFLPLAPAGVEDRGAVVKGQGAGIPDR